MQEEKVAMCDLVGGKRLNPSVSKEQKAHGFGFVATNFYVSHTITFLSLLLLLFNFCYSQQHCRQLVQFSLVD